MKRLDVEFRHGIPSVRLSKNKKKDGQEEKMDVTRLQQIREEQRGKKIGVIFSCFDLLHAGHCLILEEGKRNCDYFVVGLQTDPTVDRPTKNKPIQSVEERLIQVRNQKSVDEVVLYTTEAELVQFLEALRPDIRITGDDYVGKEFTGKDFPGVQIIYHQRSVHDYSTTRLRQRIYEAETFRLKK